MSKEKDDDGLKEVLSMTAESVGRDLLQALVQEIKLLPDVFQKLSKAKQDDVIDRLRDRVEHNVKFAVHLVASEGRTVVAGDLDQITIKDGVKAVVKFSSAAPNLHELYESSGKAVLVIVANPAAHTGGMDEIKGEADQRGLDLGHEYKPDSDGDGMDGGAVIEGEATALPEHSTADLQAAWDSGYKAAEEGQTKDDAPVIAAELVKQWLNGWMTWHEERATENEGSDIE
jgi:ribosome modulation factor